MSRHMTKPTKWSERLVKTQVSLGIRPVWSDSDSLGAHAILLVYHAAAHIIVGSFFFSLLPLQLTSYRIKFVKQVVYSV